MTPDTTDKEYEYAKGSEAEKLWGPKTADMEIFCLGHWNRADLGRYAPDENYRRKRPQPLAEAKTEEEWVDVRKGKSGRLAKESDYPIWFLRENQGPFLAYNFTDIGYPETVTFWKPAILPTPPKKAEPTQQEIDGKAYHEWHAATKDRFFNRPPIEQCWHAALAWERSRNRNPIYGQMIRAGTMTVSGEEMTGVAIAIPREQLESISHLPMYKEVTVCEVRK